MKPTWAIAIVLAVWAVADITKYDYEDDWDTDY